MAIARLCLLVVLAFAAAPAARADPVFPALTGRVVDEADLLTAAQEAALAAKLAALEEKTTDQLVVVTLPSLQDQSIEEFGYRLGRHWGIGRQDRNNGVLLIVAPNERAVRIEVGYGLEGSLTDALTRVIIDTAILPRFRQGDMAGGIAAGVDDIIAVLTGEGADITERTTSQNLAGDILAVIFIIFFIFFVILIIISMFRGLGTGSSGGWSGSSGGSRSSGGGFSGGGGSFGGGGSSGRW